MQNEQPPAYVEELWLTKRLLLSLCEKLVGEMDIVKFAALAGKETADWYEKNKV